MCNNRPWMGTQLLVSGSCGEGQFGAVRGEEGSSRISKPTSLGYSATGDERCEITSVVCGSKHTLFLTSRGTVWSAGFNDYGQLGRDEHAKNGTTTPKDHLIGPVELKPGIRIIQISTGENHCLAVSDDGRLFAWGDNREAQRVPEMVGVVQAACSANASVALLESNRVYVFGKPANNSIRPTEVNDRRFRTFRCAYCQRELVRMGQERLWPAWNIRRFRYAPRDIFGTTLRFLAKSDPVHVSELSDLKVKAVQVACGANHTVVLTEEGRVFGFGSDSFGQLGGGKRSEQQHPKVVSELLGTAISSIACGRCHTLALSNGRVYAFGLNGSGQLGDGSFRNALLPRAVDGLKRVTRIFSGWDQSVFIEDDSYQPTPSIHSTGLKLPTFLALTRIRQLVDSQEKMELISQIESVFSSTGCINGSFLYNDTRRYLCTASNSGVNMDNVMDSFNVLNESRDAKQYAEIAAQSFEMSDCSVVETLLNAKMTSCPEALRIFLILPWLPQMIEPEPAFTNSVFLPFVVLLEKVLARWSMPPTIVAWWKQFERRHFNRIVQALMSGLEFFFKKDRNNHVTFMTILNVLSVLSEINKKANKVSYDKFYLHCLSEHINIQEDYVLWYREKSEGQKGVFRWAAYPFLMNAEAKSSILEVDSLIRQHISASQAYNTFVMFPLPIRGNPYLIYNIRRDHIVEDAYAGMMQTSEGELTKPLRIIFRGEEAEDAGGVRKEFFMLLFSKLLMPTYGMFVEDEESHLVWFSGVQGDLASYTVTGILCGLAIYNQVLVDFPFPLALYKKLLGFELTLEDLIELHPTEGKSLEALMEHEDDDIDEVFCLNFTMRLSIMGHSETVELKPGGADIAVTQDNKSEYVAQYIKKRIEEGLYGEIGRQLDAFKKGFKRVMNETLLGMFQPRELMEMVIGNENYDWSTFREVAEYKGEYHKNHPVIKVFWEVFGEFSEDEKKKLMLFLMGTNRIPLKGMSELKMIIQPIPENLLPVAHTCFNLLDLPKITDKEEMRRRLLVCLDHTQGFTLV
ncbi:hect domain and RLD 4 [Aphelenchoides avenae]|nr:hect domain and RLD 4 [Aphelenchus avenae]